MIHFIPQVLSPQGLPLEAVSNEMHPHKHPTQISPPLQIDHQENHLIIRSHLEKLQEEKGKCQKKCSLLQMHPHIIRDGQLYMQIFNFDKLQSRPT